ncbi:MAG: hypothetical protein M0Q38_05140 [Bacteroidales bacterium]|nr:hypothetical protein [Bacteroidales bacterium]
MKKIITKLVMITLLGFLFIRCDKDDIELNHMEGYIVGFDPCTINHHYRIGYVIISKDLKDTLVTYNLSDNSFKMPASVLLNSSDTLYKISELYFQNYKNSAYFPDSLRYKYGVKISYSFPNENEMVYQLCTTDIIFLNLIQIVTKSATKN